MTDVAYKSKRSDSAITPEIRWAYPFVHEKSTTRPNGKPRKVPVWIVTGLLPKLHYDPAQCPNYQFLYAIILQACSREPAWGGVLPEGAHLPIQDGDAPPRPKLSVPGQPATPVDPSKGAWRKGHWLFEASTSLDPGPRVCVMQPGGAQEIPAKVIAGKQMYKGGDFGFGSIHGYTFWNEKFGVSFGFEGILWTREGEAIGSSGPRSASQMFGGVAGTVAPMSPAIGHAAPQPAPQPQAYAPPAPQPQAQYAPPAPVNYAPAPSPQAQYAPPVAPAPQQYAPQVQQYAPPTPAPQQYAPPVAPMAPAPVQYTPSVAPAPPMAPVAPQQQQYAPPPVPSTLPPLPVR